MWWPTHSMYLYGSNIVNYRSEIGFGFFAAKSKRSDRLVSRRLTKRANINNQVRANRGGVVLSVINTPTYAPIWNPENPAQIYNNSVRDRDITTRLENLARSANNKDKENRLLASGSALITFLPELTFKSSFTLDRRNAVRIPDFMESYRYSMGTQSVWRGGGLALGI
ncbi:hypothetical protein FQR65_LT16759 [Abscondita terminalis]|nr:hypothetical protein FQR65_LT16759 [Abscondita terminalis]